MEACDTSSWVSGIREVTFLCNTNTFLLRRIKGRTLPALLALPICEVVIFWTLMAIVFIFVGSCLRADALLLSRQKYFFALTIDTIAQVILQVVLESIWTLIAFVMLCVKDTREITSIAGSLMQPWFLFRTDALLGGWISH